MRTLSTQVRLRRLVRTFGEAVDRLRAQPIQRMNAFAVSERLVELAQEVRDAWLRESAGTRAGGPLDRYVMDALRTMELTIVGLKQSGADLNLLRQDFETAALPLEVFMRGLDVEPALQRSA